MSEGILWAAISGGHWVSNVIANHLLLSPYSEKKVFDATIIITKDIMNENTFVFVQEEESRFFPLSVQKEGCFCLVSTTKEKF